MGANVIARAKELSISSLGSAVLGANMDVTRLFADHALAADTGGAVTLFGTSRRASAEWGAAINCTASHCTELEDVAWPDATYTCFLIPAVYSLGEAVGASGAKVLEALVLGYEITSASGTVTTEAGAMTRGWLSASVMGAVGVAAAAAKLLDLDEAKTLNAIAIGASFGSGLARQTGSGAHVIEAGLAGRNGITAAMLAARGLTGNPTILEGDGGLWDAMAGSPEIDFPLGSGGDFRVLQVGMKKFPCCYLTQRIIDALKDLRTEHGLDNDSVASVEIDVTSTFTRVLKYPEPDNAEEARFSIPHIVTSVLAGKPMFFESFTEESIRDPALVRHRGKISLNVRPEWGDTQLGPKHTIRIATTDGRRIERDCFIAHGDPADPLTIDEVVDRFHACTRSVLSPERSEEACGLLRDAENLPDISGAMRLLAA